MSLQAIMNQIGGVETGQMTFIGTPRLSSSQRNSHNLILVLTSSTLRYIFRTCFSKLKKALRSKSIFSCKSMDFKSYITRIEYFYDPFILVRLPNVLIIIRISISFNLGNVYDNTKTLCF